MKLRARLALTVIAVGGPVVGGVYLARANLEHQTSIELLTEHVHNRMEHGRYECEDFPETWPMRPARRGPGGRGPGARSGDRPGPGDRPADRPGDRFGDRPAERPGDRATPPEGAERAPVGNRVRFFAYQADFTSLNPMAPELREELKAGVAENGVAAVGSMNDVEEGLHLLVRMEWHEEEDTASAYVLAHQLIPHPPRRALEFLTGALAIGSLLLIAILAAAGPVIGRVRKLTQQVRDASGDAYANPVDETGSDELTELAQAFNATGANLRESMEALEERERSLRRFVEGTTHDVMLPLTVLQGSLASLRDRAQGEDAELVKTALEESSYMASLLGNLSTAAKLEADARPLRQDAVDLVALTERVVARHLPIAREKDVQVESVLPGDSLPVKGDVTLLEQALSNLVHNAVRYVEEGGKVLILLKGDESTFHLRVVDDGPGISEDQLELLTERRWRADEARSRHPDGSGLGLAITREVTLRHGFELSLGHAEELGGLAAEIAGPRG